MKLRQRKAHIACCSDQRGALLVSLILTLTIIAILGAVMVEMTTTSTLGELFANRQQRAYYLAESGGRYAIPQILADPIQAETDLHGMTFTLSNGDQFFLTVDNSIPELTMLESEGIVQPGDWLESRTKITYRIPRPFAFKYGAFTGTGRLQLNNNAYLDSYDSTLGPWTGEGAIRNGSVGTNRTGKNSILIRKLSKVYGDADVGPGGNPNRDITVERNALLTGSRGTLTAAEDMTPRTMPAGGGAPVDLLLRNNQTYTYTTGVYRLNDFEVEDNAVLTISGDVTLYVEGRIRFRDFGTLTIPAGGSLTIYAADQFIAEDDARINTNGEAGDLTLFGTASFARIQLNNDVIMKGAFYSPNAQVRMQRNAELFGSVIARQVTISNDAKLHYDESLGIGGGAGGAIVQYF
ncbi:MAG: hypothetical protein JRJ82_10995 [Deltaproteobacteria bacterium]|nr:hypothetical protein [Deltaproteobacteria bacterium]